MFSPTSLGIQGQSEDLQRPNEEAVGLLWWPCRGNFSTTCRGHSSQGQIIKAFICLFAFLLMQKSSLQVEGSRRASVMRYLARSHILNVSPQSKRRTKASLEALKEFQMIKHLLVAAQLCEAQRLYANVKADKKRAKNPNIPMSVFDLEASPSGQWSSAVWSCPWCQLGWEDGWLLLWLLCTKATWPTAAVIVCDFAL